MGILFFDAEFILVLLSSGLQGSKLAGGKGQGSLEFSSDSLKFLQGAQIKDVLDSIHNRFKWLLKMQLDSLKPT